MEAGEAEAAVAEEAVVVVEGEEAAAVEEGEAGAAVPLWP
jgi:hypothetical protein